MDDFLKMDMFFVIASVATVVLSILLGMVLWHVLRIAKALDRLATDVANEAHALKEDVDGARIAAKREGRAFLHLMDVARKAAKRLAASGKSRTH